jgi:uncharacterized protein (TIGR03083 family)
MWETIAAERGALAEDLSGLTDEQWNTPSLCEGWTVREVVAHQSATASLTPPTFFLRFAGKGFNFQAFANAEIRRHLGATPADTLAEFSSLQHSTKSPPGPKASWLGETVVHSEDIRRPLGIVRSYPPDAVRQVIDFYQGSNALLGTKKRIEGITLRATDTDWSHGDGPVAEGTLIDLLMAATGRRVAADGLTGEGAATLAARCG